MTDAKSDAKSEKSKTESPLARCPACDRIHTSDETGTCPRCGYES